MQIDNATILWNQPLGSSCYRIGITTSAQYAYASPGQFVMLRLPNQTDPLLRRPFSIHRLIESENGILQGIEILVKVVGRVTRGHFRASGAWILHPPRLQSHFYGSRRHWGCAHAVSDNLPF